MEEINYGLDEMHAIQLEMTKKLISICQEHNYIPGVWISSGGGAGS